MSEPIKTSRERVEVVACLGSPFPITLRDASGSYPSTLGEMVAFVEWSKRQPGYPETIPSLATYFQETAS